MQEFWAVLVSIGLLLIIYGIISSNLKDRRIRKLRKKTLPSIPETIKAGGTYNFYLSNGKEFKTMKVVGITDVQTQSYPLFPLDALLVVERQDGKKIFIKPTAVRYFEEV